MAKINAKSNEKQKKSLLLAQDLKLIKGLSGNDKKVRERILKNLKKWFEQRTSKFPFTKEDFIRIWKGLFYTMWMADKPLIQEECAEKISQLIHFADPQTALLFFRSSLIVLTTEWFGIDQLRLDKFLMLVRRILRQGFQVLKNHNWKSELVTEFGNILSEIVLKTEGTTYLGLTMHITEIYLEELAKVGNDELESYVVAELIRPFVMQLSKLNDSRQISHIRKFLFHHLLNQSDEGIEYQVKFQAWKERGFPGGSMDALERVEEEDDEDISDVDESGGNEEPLDPRAGRVDVLLPQLPFEPLEISRLLLDHRFSVGSTTKARKAIVKLATEFEKLSQGDFPLGIKEIPIPDNPGYSTNLKKSVNRLIKFEKKLIGKNKNKRKLKRKFTEIEDEESESDTDFFKNKLEEFIKKSERTVINGSVPKKKLKLKNEKKIKNLRNRNLRSALKSEWAYEESFQRNSGTWFVEKLDLDESFNQNESLLNDSSPKGSRILRASRSLEENLDQDEKNISNKLSPKKEIRNKDHSPRRHSPRRHEQDCNGIEKLFCSEKTPKRRKSDVYKEESIQSSSITHSTPKTKRTSFPQTDWDLPMKDGEVEIFVPSNKYKDKMKKLARKSNKSVEELIDNAVNGAKKRYSLNVAAKSDNKKKKRLSLDTDLVKNPFATPKTEKKVKIVLKLNQSQEIHEHKAQIRKSPGIPYDANKKPLKPLLKPNAVASPINPFYKRKLKLFQL